MKALSLEQLYEKRKHVVELHQKGLGVMAIVRQSGLSYPTVRSTLDRFQSGGMAEIKPLARGRRPGEGRSLSSGQEQELQQVLRAASARECGLEFDSWTREAVAALIQQKYAIKLTARAVGNYLQRWGMGQAVKAATARGAPARSADHGLAPAPAEPSPSWGPQISRTGPASQTLAGQTAQKLRRDIITNQFHPGERLTFEKLSQHYAVGSSPLREALFQVMGEGLVQAQEHRGFVVAPLSTQEMLDVSSLRAQLEALALRQSIQHGDVAWEARVLSANHFLKKATAQVLQAKGANQKAATESWERQHRELHRTLCSACASPWLLHFIGILYEHLERYRRYYWQYAVRASGADHEHELIVQAALARDADQAVRLLEAHFKTQAELSLAAAEEGAAKGVCDAPPQHIHGSKS